MIETALQPPAVCFLDLVGYTRLTEERGDDAAAEIAANLAELTQRAARARGGLPVKWLGTASCSSSRPLGPVRLKGFTRPVRLHLALPA